MRHYKIIMGDLRYRTINCPAVTTYGDCECGGSGRGGVCVDCLETELAKTIGSRSWAEMLVSHLRELASVQCKIDEIMDNKESEETNG